MNLFVRKIINTIQTFAIFAVFLLIAYIIGILLFDSYIVLVAAAIAVFIIVLVISKISPDVSFGSYNAQKICYISAPHLYDELERLCEKAKLEHIPELYYIPSPLIIAFSAGTKNNSAIALSEGLFKLLTIDELYAVIAHEISHISHNDIRVMQIADIISRIINIIIYLGLIFLTYIILLYAVEGYLVIPTPIIFLLILVPAVNILLQLVLSRNREYAADLDAARFTDNPLALAFALQKINTLEKYWIKRFLPWDKDKKEPSFLRTHPPANKRIQRLIEIDKQMHPETDRNLKFLQD